MRGFTNVRALLVGLAKESGIDQSYARLAPRLDAQIGCYPNVRQFKPLAQGPAPAQGLCRQDPLRHLASAREQVAILTGQVPDLAVDRGYRSHGVDSTRILIGGMRRAITRLLARLIRRCSAIEGEDRAHEERWSSAERPHRRCRWARGRNAPRAAVRRTRSRFGGSVGRHRPGCGRSAVHRPVSNRSARSGSSSLAPPPHRPG